MGDFLSFDRLFTPTLIRYLFWIALIANTLDAFFGGHDFGGMLFTLIAGPILIRIFCEGIIVMFEMNATLKDIRKELRPAVPAPLDPISSSTPPVV